MSSELAKGAVRGWLREEQEGKVRELPRRGPKRHEKRGMGVGVKGLWDVTDIAASPRDVGPQDRLDELVQSYSIEK